MKKYNLRLNEVGTGTLTELKNASMQMILKTLKSLNKNTLEPQPMKISKKRAYIPKDKYDASIDENIAELITKFD